MRTGPRNKIGGGLKLRRSFRFNKVLFSFRRKLSWQTESGAPKHELEALGTGGSAQGNFAYLHQLPPCIGDIYKHAYRVLWLADPCHWHKGRT